MGFLHFFILSLLPSLWLFLLLLTHSFTSAIAVTSILSDSEPPRGPPQIPPPPPPPPPQQLKVSPFRPSIAVIVGVLTTLFSVTFLLLLYAKHCKRQNNIFFSASSRQSNNNQPHHLGSAGRKNSGIDRAVIESLPVFRFGSLRGQKHGLQCSVCLNEFEPTEVLRLLPKCKHAFHVECVDTWLDAHSTCPLCRYRVDPEDILLVTDHRFSQDSENPKTPSSPSPAKPREPRLSARHSSAGERRTQLEIIVEKPRDYRETASFLGRRSLDSWSLSRKKNLSSKSDEIVAVGCAERPRKDGLLLAEKGKEERRVEHRIIVSETDGAQYRWSDVEPSDLLYLRSEMLLSESRRFSGSTRSRVGIVDSKNSRSSRSKDSGRDVINERSVSEITGLSRYRSNEEGEGGGERKLEREKGVVKRWLAWISQTQKSQQQQPAVQQGRIREAAAAADSAVSASTSSDSSASGSATM